MSIEYNRTNWTNGETPLNASKMYDGRKHGKYDVHDRFETLELYDMLSEDIEKKNESLGEVSEGWSEEVLNVFEHYIDELNRLTYELQNGQRGIYTHAKTAHDLGDYVYDLGNQLQEIAEDLYNQEDELDEGILDLANSVITKNSPASVVGNTIKDLFSKEG